MTAGAKVFVHKNENSPYFLVARIASMGVIDKMHDSVKAVAIFHASGPWVRKCISNYGGKTC